MQKSVKNGEFSQSLQTQTVLMVEWWNEFSYTCIFWYLCPSVYFLLSSWKNVRKAALDSTQNRGYQRPVYKVYSYIHVKIKCTCQDS